MMQSDYSGPNMQLVPVGWFSEAGEVAARAPTGTTIAIRMDANGFEVAAQRGEDSAIETLSFFDLAMQDGDNPFLSLIESTVAALP